MSNFDSTPLHVYLISFFSLAAIAVAFAMGVAAYELARHRRLHLSRTACSSTDVGSTSRPIVDVPGGPHG